MDSRDVNVSLVLLKKMEEIIERIDDYFNPAFIKSYAEDDGVDRNLRTILAIEPDFENLKLVANLYYRDNKYINKYSIENEVRIKCTDILKVWEKSLIKFFKDEADDWYTKQNILPEIINCFLSNAAILYSESDYERIMSKLNKLLDNTHRFNEAVYIEKLIGKKYEDILRSSEKSSELTTKIYQGIAYRELYKFDKSKKTFQLLIQQNFELPRVYRELSLTYAYNGENDLAISTINKSINMDSNKERSYYYKALILAEQGDYQKGMQYINKAIEINPEFLPAYLLMTEISPKRFEDLKMTVATFNKYFDNLLKIDNENVFAHIGKAIISIKQIDFSEDIKGLLDLKNIQNNNPYYYATLALLLEERTILPFSFNCDDATNEEIENYRRLIREKQADYYEAIEYIKEAIKIDNTNVFMYEIKLYLEEKLYKSHREVSNIADYKKNGEFINPKYCLIKYADDVLQFNETSYIANEYKTRFLTWAQRNDEADYYRAKTRKYLFGKTYRNYYSFSILYEFRNSIYYLLLVN